MRAIFLSEYPTAAQSRDHKRHRENPYTLVLLFVYSLVFEPGVKVSQWDSSSGKDSSWRNVRSHVANIKLIWRCLNTACGKFVRGFANLVKFKYYVLITHKVLRPSSPGYLLACARKISSEFCFEIAFGGFSSKMPPLM